MTDTGKKTHRRVQQKCSVHTCYYRIPRYDDEPVSFFRLPKEEHRAKLWLQAIGRKSKFPRIMVCEKHFTRNFISLNNNRTRLIPTAVPTLNLPLPRDPPLLAPRLLNASLRPAPAPRARPASPPSTPPPRDASHQTTQTAGPGAETPPLVKLEPPDDEDHQDATFIKEETVVSQKRPYEAVEPSTSSLPNCPIKRERLDEEAASIVTPERQAELNKLVELGSTHLEPELARYIEAKLHLQSTTTLSRGTKDENLLLFALKLYHAFPQTYKLMQSSLGLPSTLEIKRLFRPLKWEINEQWAELLRARFSGLPWAQRECVVCVARAPLRPALAYAAPHDRLLGLHELAGRQRPRAAREAVLLVARGLHAPWRQPLACCLFGANADVSELRLWIDRVISKLFELDLDVRALINDFDDHFVPTGPFVKFEKPYFSVNSKKVYCFYDCTQLMVSFRDYFMEFNINFGGLMATWQDIEEMHEYNSTRAYPLPTGLTDEHVKPPAEGAAGEGARRRAALAVQALAQPVAAALAAAVDLRVLDDTAHGTVQLVEAVASLYDTMHNKTLSFKSKPHATGVSSTSDIKFLNEMIARLEKMSLVDKETGQAMGDPGLLAALRAGVHAALALHERMRRGGGSALPMRAFNNDPLHEFFDRVRARHRGKTPTGQQMLAAFKRSFGFNVMKSFRKSPEDGQLEQFLKAASEIGSVPRAEPAPAQVPAALVPVGQWLALLRLSRGRRSAPLLARRLLESCLLEHAGCELARVYCQSQRLPEGLLRYMELMTWKFQRYFKEPAVGGTAGLLESLLQQMADEPFEAPCACFPTRYLKILYFRFKIHTLVGYNNNRLGRYPDAEFAINKKYVDLLV